MPRARPAPHTYKHGQTKELREVRRDTARSAYGAPWFVMNIWAGSVASVQPAPHTHKRGQTKELRELRMGTARSACGASGF